MAAPGAHGRVLLLFSSFTFLTILLCHTTEINFAKTKQEPLDVVRERSGNALRRSAKGTGDYVLTRHEKNLLRKIAVASENREWAAVSSHIGTYAGNSPPLFTAAMHGALRCRQYEEGIQIYDKCRTSSSILPAPAYVAAIKLFGKIGAPSRVREVWGEALQVVGVNEILGSARIIAAADEGNVSAAAEVLDLMNASGVPVDVGHVSSAIRACWGWGNHQHKAARYLFDLLPEFDLAPNIIIFTNLIRAYTNAACKDTVALYEDMKALQIKPDTAFAETYLITILQKDPKDRWRTPETTAPLLKDKPVERLRAARKAAADFEAAGVELSNLAANIRDALKQMSIWVIKVPLHQGRKGIQMARFIVRAAEQLLVLSAALVAMRSFMVCTPAICNVKKCGRVWMYRLI